jgi:hypothetical protein
MPVPTETTTVSSAPPCDTTFPTYEVSFVEAHYLNSVSLGSQAGLSASWVLGWSAEESAFGTGSVFGRNPNSYFSWHGQGDAKCPPGANKLVGCFSSYYAAGMTALFSTQNYFNFNGQTGHNGGVTAAGILSSLARQGAAVAFQALATAGYTPSAGYGVSVATDISTVQAIVDCLSSEHALPSFQ